MSAALAVGLAALSLASFLAYWRDKRAARVGARRTPEAALHLLDLAGGWPGGLVARHLFRHKTRKQPFRALFWLSACANCALLCWLFARG